MQKNRRRWKWSWINDLLQIYFHIWAWLFSNYSHVTVSGAFPLVPDPPSVIPGRVENSKFVFPRDASLLLYLGKKKKTHPKKRCLKSPVLVPQNTASRRTITASFTSVRATSGSTTLLPPIGGGNRSESPPHYHSDGWNCVFGPRVSRLKHLPSAARLFRSQHQLLDVGPSH